VGGYLPDWLTGAEAAADSNPSILEEYASGIPGQKAHWWVPPEALARVVRDLFVYPCGPVPFRDDWLSTPVVGLAETIDARGWFEDMPVLGDALEEAGCTDEDVLRHCRHESRHFRGCWVLDLVLGKAKTSVRPPQTDAEFVVECRMPDVPFAAPFALAIRREVALPAGA